MRNKNSFQSPLHTNKTRISSFVLSASSSSSSSLASSSSSSVTPIVSRTNWKDINELMYILSGECKHNGAYEKFLSRAETKQMTLKYGMQLFKLFEQVFKPLKKKKKDASKKHKK